MKEHWSQVAKALYGHAEVPIAGRNVGTKNGIAGVGGV